jgi:Lar family restriction alleviation protein
VELKPCPYCGSKAELREHWGDCSRHPSWYEVECTNPDCGRCQDTEQEAIDAWNTRADADAYIERIEKENADLRELIKFVEFKLMMG